MATIVKDERVIIEKLELGPFGTNSYILIYQKTKDSAIADAPGEAERVLAHHFS